MTETLNPPVGTTLLQAARDAGRPLGSSCGGRGACGWCRVTVLAGEVSPPDAAERALLQKIGAGPAERVACQARALGPVTITTSYW